MDGPDDSEGPDGPLQPKPGSWRTVMRRCHPWRILFWLWVLFLGALLVFVAVRFAHIVLFGEVDPIW